MSQDDYDFLEDFNLPYHLILSRNDIADDHYKLSDGKYKLRHIEAFLHFHTDANVIMFEDSKAVKKELRKLFPVICAHKLNKRLAK